MLNFVTKSNAAVISPPVSPPPSGRKTLFQHVWIRHQAEPRTGGGIGLANKISIFRVLLAPMLIACLVYYAPDRDWLRLVALTIFVVGMASDAIDGLLARLQHQQTELGSLLDPLADKALILSALISCSVIRGLPQELRIPAWFNLVVMSRDALVVSGSLVLFIVKGQWHVRPSWLGKGATFMQMMVIPTVLLGLPIKSVFIVIAASLTILSAMTYVRMGIRSLS